MPTVVLLPWLIALLAVQSGAAPAAPASAGQDLAPHVQVSLAIRDGKTIFRSGEPIRLIASFTADRPGFQVETTIDKYASLEDQIEITPTDGVFRWAELRSMPDPHGRDYGSRSTLSARAVDMTMPLNYWFRFDEPGAYTVRVRTRRVTASAGNQQGMRLPWLTTNAVTFTVVSMSDQEEAAEASRLGRLLDTLPDNDLRAQTETCEDLAFLTGDAGTREKVRRYLQPRQGQFTGNWIADLGMGLYISRTTSLVVRLLEAELRDPTKPAYGIMTIAQLRIWAEMPALLAEAQGDMNALRARKRARLQAVRAEYIDEAVATLPQRIGSARAETAAALVSLLRLYDDVPRPSTPAPLPAAVRQVIVAEFTQLEPMTQGHLVQQYWKDIRDPQLLPALEKMLTSSDEWVRQQPMTAILDLAPERAKPLFIAEMLRPWSIRSESFFQLADETLPEMDGPLLEQIARLASSSDSRDKYQLQVKTRYLARYASASILPDVQRLYEERGSQLERETRVNVLAYLDRWDETGAGERLERALAAEKDGGMLIYSLANTRYTKALDAVLRSRLDSADPRTVESAASLMSQHGPAASRAALEARLERWLNEWSGRTAELEPTPKTATAQARLQISLIRAVLDGKSWKVSEADAARLKQGCATENCRVTFAVR